MKTYKITLFHYEILAYSVSTLCSFYYRTFGFDFTHSQPKVFNRTFKFDDLLLKAYCWMFHHIYDIYGCKNDTNYLGSKRPCIRIRCKHCRKMLKTYVAASFLRDHTIQYKAILGFLIEFWLNLWIHLRQPM